MTEAYTLLLALVLGALIGLERRLNDHVAGIHTHALVALGSAMFITLGMKLAAPAETARVASQVVMGVGFLSGAVVMRDGIQIRGLNTAVTIWCSCAVGAIAGSGNFMLAGIGALIVVMANYGLHLVEHRSGWFKTPSLPSADKPEQPKD